jgi:plasmid maintenance system antidote protein VapI
MDTSNQPTPISDLLRNTIVQALEQGQTNLLTLERETGVFRMSIRRFIRGEQYPRLDLADRLATHFGLSLQPEKRKKGR